MKEYFKEVWFLFRDWEFCECSSIYFLGNWIWMYSFIFIKEDKKYYSIIITLILFAKRPIKFCSIYRLMQ